MPKIVLYHAPGACSRVTMNALEEAGAVFDDQPVNILTGQQKEAAYLAVNPKGKVPAILIDGRLVTENASILVLLDRLYPAAQLLPPEPDPVIGATHVSDLMWCSSTLHPLARSVRMPSRFTDGDTTGVREKGLEQFALQADAIERRLAAGAWWNGDRWGIIDVYVYWNCDTAKTGGFDLTPYPSIRAHAERVRARPSFQRALAREESAVERAGIVLPAGARL